MVTSISRWSKTCHHDGRRNYVNPSGASSPAIPLARRLVRVAEAAMQVRGTAAVTVPSVRRALASGFGGTLDRVDALSKTTPTASEEHG